jgi:hypothetical protein
MGRLPPLPGDHKGNPPIHPAALAPTESWIDAYWTSVSGQDIREGWYPIQMALHFQVLHED